ncbi:MAG: magnesium/cobalt transporter CorA [Proteobacteria bacterium]|nr:magnesium/cobalt transporter CorA [Pseudomonadota bacterium]MBU1716796.1 magnesium/cobalt transporter CorA [Pseudomonadota bacterium]
MFKLHHSRLEKIGLPPGTAIHIGEKIAEKARLTVIDYDQDNYEVFFPENVAECKMFADKKSVSWINVDGLHQVEIVEELGSCFRLHALTVEDILNTGQRAKVDVFDDYVYLVLKMPEYDVDLNEVHLEQVSFILSENTIISFQEKKGDTFEAVRNRINNGKGKIRKLGSDYLLYSLLDSVVDNYFVLLEKIGDEIELVEEELIANPTPNTLRRIHFLKREMILLRKSVWPLREVINSLQRDDIPFIGDNITFYLKDLYDHTIQVIDTVETFRDIISGILDIYLSSISNRMNEVMKVLTIFAAIFIPLTFIAGIYGMNFNTEKSPFNMPELSWYFGYPFALFLMVSVAGGMLYYFSKKKWL